MTFSALYRMVWYKSYRKHIKEMIEGNDFVGAETMLENLIQEQENNIPSDNSVGVSELKHMRHALIHINAPPSDLFRLTRILDKDPEQDG